MNDLILYQYDISPFSEKIRRMLGYAGLPWRAVEVRPMPPRPALDILAGGYRKIPVAQIGADVFCDTQSIARHIARTTGHAALDIQACSAEARAFAARTDLDVFLAFIIGAGPGLLVGLARRTSVLDTLRFVMDRAAIARKARVKTMTPGQARKTVAAHVRDMEVRLDNAFLFGDTPCAADFSAFHSLWFSREMTRQDWLRDAPRVGAWFDRMTAFGTGTHAFIDAETALDAARDAEPRALGDSALAQPRRVRIAPADYARDPVSGWLVAQDEASWTLRREHARAGTVHLHFPRQGYELTPAD